MLLYYQYYYSFSLIHFIILSFPFNIILALITLSELLCVIIIQHFLWYWVTFLLALHNVLLYFISFLSHPFIRHCLVQSQFIHLFYSTSYAVFMCIYWLWMIQCHFIVLTIRDHEITLKISEFVLNSIEKVKPGFLLSSMCIFSELNKTKSSSHSFHLENSGILQIRMGKRRHPMKINFDNFQMEKWVS